MNIKVGFVSLGCSKNAIDCELMLSRLINAGIEIVDEDIFADVTEGFRIAYRYQSNGEDKASVFQTNLCGYGLGDTYWRDAPELSLAVNGDFRLFVGGRTIDGIYNPIATIYLFQQNHSHHLMGKCHFRKT